MFPGKGKSIKSEKGRNLTYREADQDIEKGVVGVCDRRKNQRPNGSQANALKNIAEITGSDWSKGRRNVRRGEKKVKKRVNGIR